MKSPRSISSRLLQSIQHPQTIALSLLVCLISNPLVSAQIPANPAETPSPQASPQADLQSERYRRSVTPAASTGTACAVLDPAIYTHAAPGLRDLRLYPANVTAGAHDLPYALTLSEPEQPESAQGRVLNLGSAGKGVLVFDLQMPPRPYTDVDLDLHGQNFLATASVSGSLTAGGSGGGPPTQPPTNLGDFTLFDLTAQHLARSTTLHLGESSFPLLHIRLAVAPVPDAPETFAPSPSMVLGATVPPSREGQTVFTVALRTSDIVNRGNQTIAHFHLPARIPIERVRFTLKPNFMGNFSRDVRVSAKSDKSATAPTKSEPESAAETTLGLIERVHLTSAGRDLRTEHLSLPATLGANLESAADVDVTIDNGSDPPLPIAEVELETRERKLCFDAGLAPTSAHLFYGDPALAAPQYDYARIFSPTVHTVVANLGPEAPNPNFHPRPDNRALTERHPGLLWVALLLVVALLGFVALRSPKSP